MTYTSTILAVNASNQIIRHPSLEACAQAKSLHVLAISSKGHLLLNESQGSFDFDIWDKVYEEALSICHRPQPMTRDGDVAMDANNTLEDFVRQTIEHKIGSDYAWADLAR